MLMMIDADSAAGVAKQGKVEGRHGITALYGVDDPGWPRVCAVGRSRPNAVQRLVGTLLRLAAMLVVLRSRYARLLLLGMGSKDGLLGMVGGRLRRLHYL